MPSVFVFLFSLVVIFSESIFLALVGWEQWTLQIGLAIVIVLGLTREFVSGGVLVALLLYPIEWTVSGVPGYYAFALVMVFFALRPVRRRVTQVAGLEALLIGALAAVVHAGIMIISLALTQPTSVVIGVVARNVWMSAISVAGSTLLIAWLFDKMTRKFKPVRGNQLEIDI